MYEILYTLILQYFQHFVKKKYRETKLFRGNCQKYINKQGF